MCTMVACISGGGDALGETMRTMGFAMKAKGILNHPNIHVDEQEQLVSNLKREIEQLKKENMQLKHIVIEVSQEASLASSKGVGSNHIGLVNDIEQMVGSTGFYFEGAGVENFDFGGEGEGEEEEEEEEKGEESGEESGEEEQQDDDSEYSSDHYEDKDVYSEDEKYEASEEEKGQYSNDDDDDDDDENDGSPNIFRSGKSNIKLSSDPEQRILELQLLIVEAKARIEGDGGEVSKQILELESELEDLQNEIQLTAQLKGLGLDMEREEDGEEEGGRREEEQERALQQMIQDTMNSAAKTPESARAYDEDDEDEYEDEDEDGEFDEAKLSPSGYNFAEEDVDNWRSMWENSLKILASDDFSDSGSKQRLEQIAQLEQHPPVKQRLFRGNDGGGGGREEGGEEEGLRRRLLNRLAGGKPILRRLQIEERRSLQEA